MFWCYGGGVPSPLMEVWREKENLEMGGNRVVEEYGRIGIGVIGSRRK